MALVIGDLVVEASIDNIRSSLTLGIERGEPIPRLSLGLPIVEDPLPIRIERVIGRTERCLTSSVAVDQSHKPHAALRSPAIAESEPARYRHPIPGFLRGQFRTCGAGVELRVADGSSL